MTTDVNEPPEVVAAAATVSDVLRARALLHGARVACTYLSDGESKEINLTYEELSSRATTVAAALLAAGAGGKPVLLLLPSGLEFVVAFFGCLYAGAIAVPHFPPARRKQLLRSILEDSGATLALISGERAATISPDSESTTLQTLDVCELLQRPYAGVPIPSPAPEALAYLQYTSASTRSARGVAIRHEQVLRHACLIWKAMGQSEDSVAVSWLPLFHDMGLVGTLITPFVFGMRTVLMSPLHFMRKPQRWLQCMARYQATSTGAPNFAYDLCAREDIVNACKGLDLSAWTLAFCGAEPVRAGTLERFGKAYRAQGFRPETFYSCYGLAEATLMVTGGDLAASPVIRRFDREAINQGHGRLSAGSERSGVELVGCGHTWGGERIAIVDPQTGAVCPADNIGEIWVSADNLTNTYWGKAEESARVFQARTATGEGPFLRTGDLGLLHEGELFVSGRLKDLIIVRGANHYSHDIEYSLRQCHPSLEDTCNAAFTVARGDEEQLVIVQELPRARLRVSAAAIREAINSVLFEEFGLAADVLLLTAPGSIPRTSSGKMMRYACRQQFLEGHLVPSDGSPAVGGET